MATDKNNVQLIGYLTEDPDVRQLPSGMSVVDLNIQVKSKFSKDDGGEGIATSFHTVTVWGQSANFLGQYSRRGSQVYISGRLKTDSWEDDQGKKRWKTKIIADMYEGVITLDPRVPLAPLDESFAVAGGLNRIDVIGNMTKDIELKQTPSGATVGNFSIATNRRWKDKQSGEQKEETEFHNVVVWQRLAEDAEKIIKKGQRVYVSGAVVTRSWEAPDGEKRFTTEIRAEKVLALGHPADNLAAALGNNATREDEAAHSSEPAVSSSAAKKEEMPDIPEIKYESEIKPEDLPF